MAEMTEGRWGAVELAVTREDIRAAASWRMREARHAVIVHLGGPMRQLETELDGVAARPGPPAAGDIWVVPAGRSYASQARGGTIRYGVLYFDPESLSALPGSDGRIAPRFAHRDEFLYRAVERLAELIGRNDDVSELLGASLGQALSLHLVQRYRAEETAPGPRGPLLSGPARERLQEHVHARLGDRITLDDLADIAGMSTHNLLVAFRQAFGTTPAQYVIAQRLRRVRWLLANSAQDITAIALETGFASHSHLTTAFRRHIGLTPRDFRRRWREDA
ncbi:helix-turn-helix domain-containing protein [Inquilinus sp. NPDC058860]|uniref:helix-turn-helix domain-containing protein n=1 Tax=Inquilinus sp. NPDC058860 TaxID=3346652 RepID=UPI0036A6104C